MLEYWQSESEILVRFNLPVKVQDGHQVTRKKVGVPRHHFGEGDIEIFSTVVDCPLFHPAFECLPYTARLRRDILIEVRGEDVANLYLEGGEHRCGEGPDSDRFVVEARFWMVDMAQYATRLNSVERPTGWATARLPLPEPLPNHDIEPFRHAAYRDLCQRVNRARLVDDDQYRRYEEADHIERGFNPLDPTDIPVNWKRLPGYAIAD